MCKAQARYIHTDLASERTAQCPDGAYIRSEELNGFPVTRIQVSKPSDALPSVGSYINIFAGKLWLDSHERNELAARTVSSLISELYMQHCAKKPPSILAVCLGNRKIASDALGPLCAEHLIVTRHLREEKPELYRAFGEFELSVLVPGVVGDTGIETSELILSAVNTARPSLILAVDALAARSTDRLATTVQLSDAGISPGSGIGNRRRPIDQKNMGIPVISIGIPTVVHSSTMVWDALEKAGIRQAPQALHRVLENERSFFVTLKEADVAVSAQAEMLAAAINLAFFGISRI